MMDTVTQVGYIWGWAIFGTIVVIFLVTMLITLYEGETEAAVGSGVLGVVFLVLGVGILWPFNIAYHQYVKTTGTVKGTTSHFFDGTQYDEIQFSDGSSRACNDTRCGLLKPEDTVTLWCVRQYNTGPADYGWLCDWGSSTRIKAQ